MLLATVLSFLFVCSQVMALGSVSLTDVDRKESLNACDTLNFTQEEYLSSLSAQNIGAADTTGVIEELIQTFLSMERAKVRAPDLYTYDSLLYEGAIGAETLSYRSSYIEYETAVNELLGWEILYDNLSFSNFQVEIDGDTAVASIVTTYRYYATNGFDTECCRVREHYFDLIKENDAWSIISATTNDPWELAQEFTYSAIDVTSVIADMQYDIAVAKSKELASMSILPDAKTETADTSLYYWSYDVDKAVEYAELWYNGVNSMFDEVSEDCQNFVSQCIWAGLGGCGSKNEIPAVSTTLVGTNSPRVWCINQSTTYYDVWYWNWAWTKCTSFLHLINESDNTTMGPRGWSWDGDLSMAQAGCAIYWDKDGNPNDTTVDHAMFVTATNGTSGGVTKSNIFIAAHNSSTNSAYEPLSTYAPASYTDSYFTTAYILCGKYPTEQP